MKKTLQEEKERFRQIVEQMEIPNNPLPDASNNGNTEMEIDDHVFCPTHTFMISVNEKGETKYDKDSIDFVVKGDSNMGNLTIANMEVNDNYTEEQIQQAKNLVEALIKRSIRFPSGCSISLSKPKSGEVEF